jgi:hypothetical protein
MATMPFWHFKSSKKNTEIIYQVNLVHETSWIIKPTLTIKGKYTISPCEPSFG